MGRQGDVEAQTVVAELGGQGLGRAAKHAGRVVVEERDQGAQVVAADGAGGDDLLPAAEVLGARAEDDGGAGETGGPTRAGVSAEAFEVANLDLLSHA